MLAENYSRGSEMVKQLLGEDFEGVLGSDFYASYNIYAGLHQSCLVQPLRDIHELKEQFLDALAERSVHPLGMVCKSGISERTCSAGMHDID
ncbi:MAG TPA: transposase [Ktedonobacteraceae bacterium]